jgi:hypothetical protein
MINYPWLGTAQEIGQAGAVNMTGFGVWWPVQVVTLFLIFNVVRRGS